MSLGMAVKNNGTTVPPVTLPLKKRILEEIVDKAKDWALMHGMAIRANTDHNFIPFVLLPTAFPLPEFEKSLSLQPILNELMHSVAHDYEFLKETLKDTIETDAFTKHLFDIYEAVQAEGVAQDISLGILRSDYMLDTNDSNQIKQVEINTISSSLTSMGPKISDLHKFLLLDLGYKQQLTRMPENKTLTETTLGLVRAWELYNQNTAVVLIVNDFTTMNVYDVRFQEFEISKCDPCIKVLQRSLSQIADSGQLGPNKELFIDDYEVAVVYYRSGFKPKQYPTKNDWDARLLVERSLAIKCPSINYHLAGTKKVQQALAKPHTLEKYLKSGEAVKRVRGTFTGLYSLDFNEDGEQAICMALSNPEKYVLKPQREGGSNNVFGAEVCDALSKMKDSPERKAWILMDKIDPQTTHGYVIRPNKLPEVVDLQSELGVYGVVIGNASQVFYNKTAGYLLRTKLASSNEGGVLHGAGALDSVYLIE